METNENTLELLLADAENGDAVLEEGVPLESAGAGESKSTIQNFWDLSGDPADLEAQGWGVVVPEGERGDRLLGLIGSLVKHRADQQGGELEPFRVPPKMTADDTIKWRRNVFEARKSEERPRYVLILGDLDEVSLEMQQHISTQAFVGRLAFSSDEEYEAYAAKVIRRDTEPAPEQPPEAYFYTVRDGTAATTIGYNALMKPSVAVANERKEAGDFPVRNIIEMRSDDDSEGTLLERLASPHPGILFSISHGLGRPRRGWKPGEQYVMQGAMSLGSGERIAGEDVKKGAFLPGGVWFFLACYGGGTPATSAYRHWLARLQKAGKFPGRVDAVLAGLPDEGDRPFIAALPKSVLANPDGPLAVIAHIDLAWTYSFQDMGEKTRNRPHRFQDVFRSLSHGGRAGMAHLELLHFLNETEADLNVIYDKEEEAKSLGKEIEETPARSAEKANLWMLRQDLKGYITLGDPASKIPGAKKPSKKRRRPVEAAVPEVSAPPPAAPPKAEPAAPKPGVSLEKMEEIAVAKIYGEKGPKGIAKEYGVSQSEVERWADIYQEAGLAALKKLL